MKDKQFKVKTIHQANLMPEELKPFLPEGGLTWNERWALRVIYDRCKKDKFLLRAMTMIRSGKPESVIKNYFNHESLDNK